ncbi:hypothetical protein HHK36_022270 [Tetracentron sinense]|uniref:Protein kinase domain-containing protein n=1 Tax=Tetracentron sinense TaxID=13715 RepID=A0A834YQI6_TETSI|nr:hypothetical protein HHK36_022270 [Tetracentron sinense]
MPIPPSISKKHTATAPPTTGLTAALAGHQPKTKKRDATVADLMVKDGAEVVAKAKKRKTEERKRLHHECGKGGTYEDRAILVKKFTANPSKEYIGWCIKEVAVASQMSNHKNVLKLLGCCLETELPTLVYEFAASGCLSNHIFEEEFSPSKKYQQLSWESRLRIAKEIADAIAYLHTGMSKPIVHRFIYSRTIFLDQQYVAKLFEFGLFIPIPLGETHADANVVGYPGFIAPESDSTRRFTVKSDVYSFGVVLFEILTGKRVLDLLKEVYGVSYSESLLVDGNEKELRVYLKANFVKGNIEQLMACAELAIRCVSVNPEERPSMMEVSKELRRIRRFQHYFL